ncbi:hypothetical protein CAEBREN_08764 [Caenorhabditis brenneri]|uniref:DUF7809 domain-containing protein n=1 Tax=Caenorhabditis brenneri TaxID=135651 RepID=G0NHV3_CAEBE|nr:hypothetical protein CAEBREN_08764 [Caenorhabditis brenneri]
MTTRLALQAKESVVGASRAYLPREHWHLIRQHDDGSCSLDHTDPILEMYGGHPDLFKEILKFRMFPGSHKLFDGGLTELLTTEETVFCNAARQTFIYKMDWFQLLFEVVLRTLSSDDLLPYEFNVMPVISYFIQSKEAELINNCEIVPFYEEKLKSLQKKLERALQMEEKMKIPWRSRNLRYVFTYLRNLIPSNADDPGYAAIRKLIESHVELKPVKEFHTYYEDWINRVAISIQILEGFIAENPEIFQLKTEGIAIVRVFRDRDILVMTHELLSEMRKAGMDCKAIEQEIVESPALSTWDFDTVQAKLGNLMENIEFVFSPVKRTRHRAIYIPTIDGGYCIPAEDAFKESFHYMMSVKCVFQQLGEWPGPDAKNVWDFCEDIVEVLMEDFHGTRFINVKQIASLQASLEWRINNELDRGNRLLIKKQNNCNFYHLKREMERLGYLRTCSEIQRYAEATLNRLKIEFRTEKIRTWHAYIAMERCMAICILGKYPTVERFIHLNKMCTSLQIECALCIAEQIAAEKQAEEKEKESAERTVQLFQILLHFYVHEDVLPLFTLVNEGFEADFTNTKAAIYGSCPKELTRQLLDFNTFAGSLHRFGYKSRVYQDPHPVFYSYQKGREKHAYVYKQSIFNILMMLLPLDDPKLYGDSLIQYALGIYFNHHEAKLKGENELVPTIDEKFDALRIKLEEGLKTQANEMNKHNTTAAKSLQLVKKALERLCPKTDFKTLTWLFNQIGKEHLIENEHQFWRRIVHTILVFLRIVDKFVKDERAYFLPNRMLTHEYQQQPRMFQNGDKHFFLVREILREMKVQHLEDEEFEEDLQTRVGDDEIATISVQELEEEWERLEEEWKRFGGIKPFDEIARVIYPIRRTKHHAVFIPSVSDKHCILASDCFLECLRTLISVKGIFQVVNDFNWNILMDEFRIGKKFQEYEAKSPILMDTVVVTRTNNLIISQVMSKMKEYLPNIKEVTPIGDEGFDQAVLEEQIRTLNLDTSFPNIMEFVPVVFPQISLDKEILKTCDMYDALEQCQLLAFFEKFPERNRWLRLHGAHLQIPFIYLEPPAQPDLN